MKHIHGRIPLVEFTIILLFYTCRKISFSITFSFNPFRVKPGCSAHQTRLVTKRLCTGIFYRKWRINVKSCFYYNINQKCVMLHASIALTFCLPLAAAQTIKTISNFVLNLFLFLL